jgi:signal transduction histidine kinase
MSWTLNAAGEIEYYIAQVQDVTAQKELQRTKSEFVATVSHELRTPLTSIKGALGLISGKMAGELPPGMARMLEIALNNCNRLSALVNDILDMEKISSGKMTFEIGEHIINDLINNSIEEVRPYAVQYGVGIDPQIPAREIHANVDPARFAQVVNNLMSNAVKFSFKGGTVGVRVEEGARTVRISVIDNGTGIPEAFKSRIFQPFSQADSSDTRKKGGTGLGRNISRQMVEMMGGTIGFQTKEGFGSTFWFELPVAEPAEAAAPRPLVPAEEQS